VRVPSDGNSGELSPRELNDRNDLVAETRHFIRNTFQHLPNTPRFVITAFAISNCDTNESRRVDESKKGERELRLRSDLVRTNNCDIIKPEGARGG